MGRPVRDAIPIYLASMGPRSVELAFEIADGWIPIFFQPERAREIFPMNGARDSFDIAPSVPAVLLDDVQAARDALKGYYALYIGGMGARGKNFYNELVSRYGYEADAKRIQDLYLAGKKEDATAAVPDALVDEVALCGPKERIRERLSAWKGSGVTTLIVGARTPDAVRVMAELVL